MSKLTKQLTTITALVLICTVMAHADSFEDLSVMHVKDNDMITIRYDRNITEIINKPIEGEAEVKVLVTRLLKSSPARYLIVFDPGPSADPQFIIYQVVGDTNKKIISIPGEELIIPGNGVIYSSGFANMMFNTRRKFQFSGGLVEEVKQPYYYVGLTTNVKRAITLHEDLTYKKPVAQLPEGANVEVLLSKGNDYLLKTPFGLVGWFKINYGEQCGSEAIEGICYHGD